MQPNNTPEYAPGPTADEIAAGHDLSGRTAIVTGGASGLGLETVRALAGAGAQVVAAVRDTDAARVTLADIAGPTVEIERLDLADLESVRDFAARWGKRPLHYLINNAGVMNPPFGRTPQAFEIQLGTNHLGHFLLTRLLTPALAESAPSRVVCLTSGAHAFAAFDFEDPNFERRPYEPRLAYGQSKTANALFALEFDRRHRDLGIHAFSAAPGVVYTPLMRHMTDEMMAQLNAFARAAGLIKTPQQGAATTVWGALAPELEEQGGRYLDNCVVAPHASGPGERGVQPHARDAHAAERLWEWSERAVGLASDGPRKHVP